MDKPFFEWFAGYARKTWREYLLFAILGWLYWWTSTNYLRIFAHGAAFLGLLVTASFWFGWQYGVGKWENVIRLISKDVDKDENQTRTIRKVESPTKPEREEIRDLL